MFILGNAEKNLLVDNPKDNKYYDETIKIDITDTNNTHAIIASKIENNSVCLDVGCGAGYTGELLKREKNCTVYGIEIDKEAIKVALKHDWYKEIFCFSVTDENDKNYQSFFQDSLKFDYILFADVLEHLPNPGEILYLFSKKLKQNGKILTSLPNIAHFDISQNLINRTFNYNNIGLIDNTHLRFFTRNSFFEMIDKVNEIYGTTFHVEEIGKTIILSPDTEKYPNLYEILNQDGEACVLQYVYEIEKVKKKKSKNNPLTDEDKELNNLISNIRISVEHVNCQVKIFRILAERYRSRIDTFYLRALLCYRYIRLRDLLYRGHLRHQ